MLHINRRSPRPETGATKDGFASPADVLASYSRIIRRQFPIILITVACGMALAVIYLLNTPPRYTASATMVIDPRTVKLFQQQPDPNSDKPVEPAAVETQMEILQSDTVSLSVIKNLDLTDDPEFVGSGGGLISVIFGLISNLTGANADQPKADLDSTRNALSASTRDALSVFADQRSVKRVGQTYAMEIEFTSLEPAKAARIANAIAKAYIDDQLDAKYQATKRASVWLQERIKELRTESSSAAQAVVDFKKKSNIVDSGGRLMTDQQLSEVNSQLITARGKTAEAKARLDRIQEILKSDVPDASVTDALQNNIIVRLRQQYLEVLNREATWSKKYGRNHSAVVNLRNQMQELRNSMRDELERIAASYRSDYDIARAREETLSKHLASVVSATQLGKQAQVQLQALESNAQSYQSVYDELLQRYMQAVQQQGFPITEARLISPALTPMRKSHPKTVFVLAVAFLGSLMLSFGIAMAREFTDNVFRTTSQVEEDLQTNCLAILPSVKHAEPAPLKQTEAAPFPNWKLLKKAASLQTLPTDGRELLSYVVQSPFSRFAEAMRAIKLAADLNGIVKANRVIAITSTLPHEGKTTIAANLAQLIALAGARAILVDADLRNPSLTAMISPQSKTGLVDVVVQKAKLEGTVSVFASTKLAFLPAGANTKLLNSTEILASQAMKNLIDRLRSSYDYVIIDLPPLAPIVDARATAHFVDSYVFVIEWGKTKFDVVRHNLAGAQEIYDRLLGVILNKADTDMLARYESYQSNRFQQKHYARYGYVE